ncbi:hypothetical protein BLNAU_6501 [Blattamonas nauphoetae]|uniref:Uncharacterized protein n=1 Tax=Blattamonas nauphoetae TaxID=2049346 RepID=A0ABQ9Y3Z8_9EUKA|nr:hypothetical protein BLNAU_6501 [Blattamonas nauphoetae]
MATMLAHHGNLPSTPLKQMMSTPGTPRSTASHAHTHIHCGQYNCKTCNPANSAKEALQMKSPYAKARTNGWDYTPTTPNLTPRSERKMHYFPITPTENRQHNFDGRLVKTAVQKRSHSYLANSSVMDSGGKMRHYDENSSPTMNGHNHLYDGGMMKDTPTLDRDFFASSKGQQLMKSSSKIQLDYNAVHDSLRSILDEAEQESRYGEYKTIEQAQAEHKEALEAENMAFESKKTEMMFKIANLKHAIAQQEKQSMELHLELETAVVDGERAIEQFRNEQLRMQQELRQAIDSSTRSVARAVKECEENEKIRRELFVNKCLVHKLQLALRGLYCNTTVTSKIYDARISNDENSAYALLNKASDGFELIPCTHWYQLHPNAIRDDLTLEEVERNKAFKTSVLEKRIRAPKESPTEDSGPTPVQDDDRGLEDLFEENISSNRIHLNQVRDMGDFDLGYVASDDDDDVNEAIAQRPSDVQRDLDESDNDIDPLRAALPLYVQESLKTQGAERTKGNRKKGQAADDSSDDESDDDDQTNILTTEGKKMKDILKKNEFLDLDSTDDGSDDDDDDMSSTPSPSSSVTHGKSSEKITKKKRTKSTRSQPSTPTPDTKTPRKSPTPSQTPKTSLLSKEEFVMTVRARQPINSRDLSKLFQSHITTESGRMHFSSLVIAFCVEKDGLLSLKS